MTVHTSTIDSWVKENPNDKLQTEFRRLFLEVCLIRHVCADWGRVCLEDSLANEDALINDGRLMSVYELDNQTVWIITEYDRSVTTILDPMDY